MTVSSSKPTKSWNWDLQLPNDFIASISVGSTLLHFTITCKDLTQSSEIEKPTLGHGEELTQEHQKRDGGEDHGEDHQDLHSLKPLWKTIPTYMITLSSHISLVYVKPLWWRCAKWNCALPVSLEDEQSQLPVKLSNLQLYQRSEFSMPPHSHQDFKERKYTAGYLHSFDINKHYVPHIITTFSMVAMNSIARVMRWSRVTNISRYAIFTFLPKVNKQINRLNSTFLACSIHYRVCREQNWTILTGLWDP